jgi:hypothetical protein
MQIEGFAYHGRLEESEFLYRIFDLSKLESFDMRFDNADSDIWQHRVNNPNDWPDNWVYSDPRFNLMSCDDSVLLQFLCETIHPIVRGDTSEVTRLLQIYNEHLKNDGYEILERTRVSNKAIFTGRKKITGTESIKQKNSTIAQKLDAEYVTKQINLMESSIENLPHVAIGIAKELIETCCKKILEERNIEIDKNWDLIALLKNTNKELQLQPEDVAENKKAAKTIKSILGSLIAVVHGICELRNEYGSGHGKSAKFQGLGPRHAKLAVGASTTLAIFLLETHELKTNAG